MPLGLPVKIQTDERAVQDQTRAFLVRLKELIEAHIHLADIHSDVAANPGELEQGHDAKLPRIFHQASGVPGLHRQLGLGGLVAAGWCVLRAEGCGDERGAGQQ